MEEVNKFCELLMLLHPPWEVRRWPVKKAAKRSRLAPVVKAAKTVWKHIEEILNAAVRGISNALSESINSKVQWIKRQACGYRSRKRFPGSHLLPPRWARPLSETSVPLKSVKTHKNRLRVIRAKGSCPVYGFRSFGGVTQKI